METLLPLLFSVLLITFVTMSAICLYDMYRMAKVAQQRARDGAARQRRGHGRAAADDLIFLRRNDRP